MREIMYSEIHFGAKYFEIVGAVKGLMDSVADSLMNDYNVLKPEFDQQVLNANVHLQYLTAVSGNIQGKRVLDLGCGSAALSSDFRLENFSAPWLCRILYALGNNPVGVDIRSLDGEKFEHYSLDLLIPNALANLPDSSFDVVHARSLFCSPGLLRSRGSDAETLMYQRIKDQVSRLLVPEGVFLHDYGCY